MHDGPGLVYRALRRHAVPLPGMKPLTHSFSHRLLSLLLAGLVLTASVGLTVGRHSCRVSGQSWTHLTLPGLSAADGCAPALEVSALPELSDDCCDVAARLHKLSSPSPKPALAKVLVPAPLLLALPPAALVWPSFGTELVPAGAQGVRWFAADSSPPAPSGRAVLLQGSKLVV